MRISDWSSDVCSSDLSSLALVPTMQAVAAPRAASAAAPAPLSSLVRSEEHTSELQSLMRISYAVFCLKKKTTNNKFIKNSSTTIAIRTKIQQPINTNEIKNTIYNKQNNKNLI